LKNPRRRQGNEKAVQRRFVSTPRKEHIASPKQRDHIPIIAIVDTSLRPDEVITYTGNDDAIRAIP
jgi:ribosomal protein S2